MSVRERDRKYRIQLYIFYMKESKIITTADNMKFAYAIDIGMVIIHHIAVCIAI